MLLYYKIFGHQPRPWGHEVRADVWDDDKNHYPICMTFPERPEKIRLNSELERRLNVLTDKLLEPPEEPEKNYMQSEVIEILIEKGLLEEGQKFPDDLVGIK